MKESVGTIGLILNEPFLWEKGRKGRSGFSLPRRDVESVPLDQELTGEGPKFPDLSEVDVVRHYTRLSQWNFGVDTGMYPLGSCTMKYSPKTNERQANLPGFAEAHPMLPPSLSQGVLRMMFELEQYLKEITGMDATTLQPAAGAHGELTGMFLIHAFHKSKGSQRSKIIVPDTAHGTNPASAALCGYRSVLGKSNEQGILSVEAIEEVMDEDTAGIMITNPNTLGLFEENSRKIAEIIHAKGGLVYCDGANMNAVMGLVQMGKIGVDVMHLNLHKTFSTPHGGGGPGSGPVCVKRELEPFLPVPRIVKEKERYVLSGDYPESIGKVQAFHGNVGVMIKAYSYIRSMGPKNLKKASQLAVLNANYIKESLKGTLHLPYDRPCMHECVFSDEHQKADKVTTLDMAKRLMEYGFHPPTVYFPLVVHGAIMIEPTETESKEDIDQFIEAFKAIVSEARQNPDLLHDAPRRCKVRRLDEVTAARKPCLAG
ncbi:MAG: aminomethyl-transferring glycine dehydrogenase subunit GcvPB [Deltaproteobacteria bacterium]|nr:aminomethyl-transferring glycine dehydrogenase subunit GcvPB [Deltaproteobacteria bacterium]MBW1718255.1 aminomethyl-transferring glycine dehydrogenase subunit GcvPB [Deltaproteobacteria bacterium]MBW1931996.1 aminomethyl-transferring glycine dehydrogenase subunit GcvPB [Deltaproteobacteria bacterium]MBW1938852.1 aminomethyl-transferring glycine dehydrogenase subunit GcvPB [Deltaproteobacteria bacterium]MBW1963951.1 aminomethyl-transferring glycine dehydrogenase subunit GcvPB [Deltaproteobac